MADHAGVRAASGAGQVLAGAARAVAAVRTASKPLHPRGTTWSGALVRHADSPSGVEWLDGPSSDRVFIRLSRAAGLPKRWPDVHGLAIRSLAEDGSVADVLLATTGSGPLGRFVLHAGRRPEAMFFGSLLPYRSSAGPVVLGALLRDDATWELLWAMGRAPWIPFARLAQWEPAPGEDISFDPVVNRPPGLEQYDALARLRLPAYRTARRSRGVSLGTAVPGTEAA